MLAVPDTVEPLPDGVGLVTAAAKALTGLRSVRFTPGTSGTIPGLPLRRIEGDATLDNSPNGVAQGRAATDAKTETTEKLGDVETYRVAAKLPKTVVSSVVPGIQSDVNVKFWIEQAENHRLMRVWMHIPPSQPNEGAVTLELALSNQNAPVTPRRAASVLCC